jgi:hypothetical protein
MTNYNRDAVAAAIKSSRKPIGKREAALIHTLLKGWSNT